MPRRPRRFLVYCLAAVIPAAGLLTTTAVSAGASVAAKPSASAEAAGLARSALQKLAIGPHPTDPKTGPVSPPKKGLTDDNSTNWSGYADTGSSFSKISSTWTEPSATCSGGAEQL